MLACQAIPLGLVYGQAIGLLRFSLAGAALLYWAGSGRLPCWPGLGKYGPLVALLSGRGGVNRGGVSFSPDWQTHEEGRPSMFVLPPHALIGE